MPSWSDPATISAIAAVFSAVAAGIAAGIAWLQRRTYEAQLRVMRSQQYNEAAARFRNSFVDQIAALQRGDKDVFDIVTKHTVQQHRLEKIVFVPYLSADERIPFEEASRRYVEYALSAPTRAPGNRDNRPREIQEALDTIQRVLDCARPR